MAATEQQQSYIKLSSFCDSRGRCICVCVSCVNTHMPSNRAATVNPALALAATVQQPYISTNASHTGLCAEFTRRYLMFTFPPTTLKFSTRRRTSFCHTAVPPGTLYNSSPVNRNACQPYFPYFFRAIFQSFQIFLIFFTKYGNV